MDKNELKRLERADDKAHKKRSREPLYEWGIQLEKQIEEKIRKFYEEKFRKDMSKSIEWYIIAIAYTLHFNEKCKFGRKRLQDIMEDLTATVDLFGTKEYTAEDYLKQLEEDGIILNNREEEK